MSCRQHGYPWPSLATSPYHSSPPAGLQGYILCPHIVAVCKFELVVLLLHGHMWGSIGVHHLWARPCFSSSVPRVWLSNLYSFRDGGQVSVKLVSRWVLSPGLVQYCSQLLQFTLDHYLMMLSVKQGGIKYHFLSFWYYSIWDLTPVSQTIDEHSTN